MAPRYDIEGGKVKRRLAVKDVLLVMFVLGGLVLTMRARSSAMNEMARSSKLIAEHSVALTQAEERRLDETTRLRSECEAAAGETATIHQAALDAMEETMKEKLDASSEMLRRAQLELGELRKSFNESKSQWSLSSKSLSGKCEASAKRAASRERSLDLRLRTCDALLKTAEYHRDAARAERDLARKQSQKIESAAAQLADTVHNVATKIEPATNAVAEKHDNPPPQQQQQQEEEDPTSPHSVLPKMPPPAGMDDDDLPRSQIDERPGHEGGTVNFQHAPRIDD